MKFISNIMDNLSYRVKFSLIALFVTLFSGFMVYSLVDNYQQQIQFSSLEIVGAKTLPSLKDLLIDTQKLRGKTSVYLSGNKTVDVQTQQNTIKPDLDKVEQALITANLPKIMPKFQSMKKELVDLMQNAMKLNAQQSFKHYSKIIQEELDLIAKVGDMSNLILDPDLDSYYLMDAVINKLPTMMEFTGKTRGLSASVAARGGFANSDETLHIAMNLSGILQSFHAMSIGLKSAYDFNASLKSKITPSVQPIQIGIKKFKNDVETLVTNGHENALFSQGTTLISSIDTLYDLSNREMIRLITLRVDKMVSSRNLTLIEAALFFVFLLSVLSGIYSSVINAVDSTVKQFAEIGKNKDLTQNIKINVKDELKNIADSYNLFRSQINEMMHHISDSTVKVAERSQQLTGTSGHVHDVVATQQAEIEQVATAMNEMIMTVQEVAKNALMASENVNETERESAEGTRIVDEAIASIEQLATGMEHAAEDVDSLREESKNIDSVLNVIRGIAEQTNLLALNAAIEAARAGEQGRGFAVVADEVRTLASRTQESTQEIQTMIEKFQLATGQATATMKTSTEEAKVTVAIAMRAGEALHTINERMGSVTDMNAQIASAAEAQSVVGEEIDRNITNINTATSKVAVATEQNTDVSNQLTELSGELEALVQQFKI